MNLRRSWLVGVVVFGLAGASCGDDDPAGDDLPPAETSKAPSTEQPSAVTTTSPPAASSTTELPTPATTAVPVSSTVAPSTVAPTTIDTVADTTAATTSTVAATTVPPTSLAPDAPVGGERPIVAIDGAGDAVYFPSLGSPPVLLYDGPEPDIEQPDEGPGPNVVDVVAIAPDASSAWVGLCCEPIAGVVFRTEPPAPASPESSQSTYGYGPAVDPTGTYLAMGQIAGSPIAVTSLSDGSVLPGPPIDDASQFSPYDTIWLGDTLVAALGILNDPDAEWVIIVQSVTDGQLVDVDVVEIAPLDDSVYYFAGTLDGGRVAVHAIGAATALAVPITGPGEIDVLELPGPSQSYWFGGVEADIRVDGDGVLTVGDQVVPGEFTWARG